MSSMVFIKGGGGGERQEGEEERMALVEGSKGMFSKCGDLIDHVGPKIDKQRKGTGVDDVFHA